MMQIPMLCHYIHTNKMHLSWESVAGVGFSDDTEQMCRDVIRDRGLFSLMHLIHVIVGDSILCILCTEHVFFSISI